MPTIQEILNDIDARLPNTFSVEQKVGWLREGLRKVFKYMPELNTSYTLFQFFTTKDSEGNVNKFYLLPDNCTADLILSLQITKDTPVSPKSKYISYELCPLTAEFSGFNYYDGTDGTIGIYPAPDSDGWDCKLFYSKRPFLLSADNLSAIPEINEDYQDAIKYYAMQVIASAGHNPDTQLANLYRVMYNEVYDQMWKDYMEKKVKTPVKKRANRWW